MTRVGSQPHTKKKPHSPTGMSNGSVKLICDIITSCTAYSAWSCTPAHSEGLHSCAQLEIYVA